jgi:5-methylcytosine-specific restriction protein A
MGVRWKRHSAWVTKSKRWPALRQQALRRDGFKCVKCGAAGRLEVDHIQPVRTHPELAFILDNLQCHCIRRGKDITMVDC